MIKYILLLKKFSEKLRLSFSARKGTKFFLSKKNIITCLTL